MHTADDFVDAVNHDIALLGGGDDAVALVADRCGIVVNDEADNDGDDGGG